ncbi:MAG: DUF4345 domain-containing protein [Halieaceae bacterium]
MNFQTFVIYLAAGFFLLYGIAFTIYPGEMARLVTESEPVGVSALVDFRATYGGMTVAVGVMLFYLHSIGQVRPSLVIVVLVLSCMAITRTIGLYVDGAGNFLMYAYLVLEIIGSGLGVFALRAMRDNNH